MPLIEQLLRQSRKSLPEDLAVGGRKCGELPFPVDRVCVDAAAPEPAISFLPPGLVNRPGQRVGGAEGDEVVAAGLEPVGEPAVDDAEIGVGVVDAVFHGGLLLGDGGAVPLSLKNERGADQGQKNSRGSGTP